MVSFSRSVKGVPSACAHAAVPRTVHSAAASLTAPKPLLVVDPELRVGRDDNAVLVGTKHDIARVKRTFHRLETHQAARRNVCRRDVTNHSHIPGSRRASALHVTLGRFDFNSGGDVSGRTCTKEQSRCDDVVAHFDSPFVKNRALPLPGLALTAVALASPPRAGVTATFLEAA